MGKMRLIFLIFFLVSFSSTESFLTNYETHNVRLKRSPTEQSLPTTRVQNRPRGSTYTGDFVPVSISSGGRNVIIPHRPVSSSTFGENPVPVFRTEAQPNARLNSQGVMDKTNKKGVEPMLFMGIGSDSKRTEDFMQQSRARETQGLLTQAKELQAASRSTGDLTEKSDLQTEANKLKAAAFSANGQNIKSSFIPLDTARKIVSSSVPERLNVVGTKGEMVGTTSDIKNVDVTKSHNQFGVRGQPLQELKAGISEHGVHTGTTYGGRRRSEPIIKYTPTINSGSSSIANGKTVVNNNNNNGNRAGSLGTTGQNKNKMGLATVSTNNRNKGTTRISSGSGSSSRNNNRSPGQG